MFWFAGLARPEPPTIDPQRVEAAPVTPGGLQGRNVSDEINNPSNQPADERPVDPNKLQVAADVELEVFDNILISPALDLFLDEGGRLLALTGGQGNDVVADSLVDLPAQVVVAEQMPAGFLRRIFHPPPKVRAVVPLILKIPAGPLQERRDQHLEGLVFGD
jgi:hypothetical protein